MDAATASDAALDVLQIVGTIAFAISGVLVAGGRKMDWFGVVVLGVMVAVGGGTLRDLLLGAPVFWIESPWFVALAAATALVTVALVSIPQVHLTTLHYRNLRLLSDALGLAVFAALGTQKALELGTSGLWRSLWVSSLASSAGSCAISWRIGHLPSSTAASMRWLLLLDVSCLSCCPRRRCRRLSCSGYRLQ